MPPPPVAPVRVRLFLLVALSLLLVPDAASAQPGSSGAIPPNDVDLQGHRGARGLAPENTIPAFRRALELGVTTLEMDVVISGDGQVVVSHEPWMSHEICSLSSGEPVPANEARSHNLYRMTYAEIEQYDCGRRQHPDFPQQDTQPTVKPLLRDVIAMAESYVAKHDRPPVFYNVEIKSRPDWDGTFHPEPEEFARRVLNVVREGGAAARTTIQSFDVRALRVARRLRLDRAEETGVQLALLVVDGTADSLPDQVERLGFTPAVYSPGHRSVDAALLRAAHDRGLRVVPWTVNDRREMQRLIRLGVDGLITDYPDVGMEVVEVMEDTPN
ncbi:MAG: glycerophosphodiester phosphodiesterase [Bacteroidetes bacterium QH_10_64_19]|nr:MAG: glycerophosphodiester phosphodiesterase [Bacteroidetes bacterium QH_10_64_19]